MSEDYPSNFVVSDHIGFALGDFSGKHLIEHDSRAHACATAAEYQTMKPFPSLGYIRRRSGIWEKEFHNFEAIFRGGGEAIAKFDLCIHH